MKKKYTTFADLIRHKLAKYNKTEGQTTERHTTELTDPEVIATGHTVAQEATSAGLGPPSVGAYRRHLRQGLETWYINTGCPLISCTTQDPKIERFYHKKQRS